MAEVSWICKRTVVSTKAVDAGKLCSLSVLDSVMEHNYLRIVFYYRTPKGRKLGEWTKMLRESVSEMLCAYPIVTGRLLKNPGPGPRPGGRWTIKCNDAGVSMVETTAKGSVDGWLQNVDREKEIKLVYWEPMFHKPYFWSAFYIQLTEFEEGGLAVGLSCSHLLCDPISATMFIKAWADMSLSGKMVSPPLYHPLKPQRNLDKTLNFRKPSSTGLISHYISALEKPITTPVIQEKQTTISLAFRDEMVRSCISMASSDPDHLRRPTPFEALSGLFWSSVSNIKGRGNGLINMSVCLDMRKVLALDKCFFGNCMVYNKVPRDGVEAKDWCKAAAAIAEAVDEMDAEGIMDLIDWLEEKECEFTPRMNGRDLICANLEDLDSYSAKFYDNFKPVLASYHIEPAVGEGKILVLPAPPGDQGPLGRMVMITFPEDEAIKLLEDKSIQQFSPEVLMMAADKEP